MKWISVKERLPEDINWCLVIDSKNGVWSVAQYDTRWKFYDTDPEGTPYEKFKTSSCGFKEYQCEGIDYEDITHWMPLPCLPSEEPCK